MRKLCIILLVIGLPIMSYSKSDFEIAKEFMLNKGVVISDKALTRASNSTYSVFEGINGKGYIAVENGIVIAYSTEESLDNFTVRPSSREYELTPKTPIEPLIEAKFNQESRPYRDSLPLLESTYGLYRLSPVGCGALAVAKIMYYYKNEGCEALEEVNYNGKYPTLEALPSTKFDWNNILPKYTEGEYTEEQAIEVAKLMKYVGYAVHSEYEPYSTGSWVKPQWLTKLGFSEESYTTVDSKYDIGTSKWSISFDDWKISDLEMEALFDRELEQGRPVMIAGYNKSGTNGHWQIIDGRDDTGRYHVDGVGYMIISQEMFMEYGAINGILGMLYKLWCLVPIYSQSLPPTSINDKTYISDDKSVYNLQGHKVGNSLECLKKGVYIMGGKKYIVK